MEKCATNFLLVYSLDLGDIIFHTCVSLTHVANYMLYIVVILFLHNTHLS